MHSACTTSTVREYDFFKANYESMNAAISSIDWDVCLDSNMDANTSLFYDKINETISKYVPVRTRIVRNSPSKPYLDKHIAFLKNRMKKAYKIYSIFIYNRCIEISGI